jgi:hypothetical protein
MTQHNRNPDNPTMNRRALLGSVGAASLLPAAFAAPTHAPPLAFQAALRLGQVQNGQGNHRWAAIIAGTVSGARLAGRVQAGRMDWFVDPCCGSVEVALACTVSTPDGVLMELRDRTASASASDRADLPGHPTAPVLSGSSARPAAPRMIGRLDTTAFWRGFVSLRAFESV